MGNMASWLNSAFAGFDGGIFRAMNALAIDVGGFFTPLSKVITLIGEKGLIFFAAAVILMLFSKTRKLGVCMFGAVACGAILTNFILKDAIARPRPFESSSEFEGFWEYLGKPAEDGYSFPSGHMTAITAAAVALFAFCNKKWSWVGFIGMLFMGFSRVYLIAHYPTDVLAGIIVGAISGVIAYFITKLIFYVLKKYSQTKFCDFCLNFDIKKLFSKKDNLNDELNRETDELSIEETDGNEDK